MASTTDELMLLERVFLRLGSADTDEQLQSVLCKFLPPVLLKLSSSQETVRKKVMELLIHVNKRVKNRPEVQLPVEALLLQYQDPSATSFVTNFTIIYIKLGFPRLPVEKQTELVPAILNALENKPQLQVESLLLLVIPLLGKVKVPTDPQKIPAVFGLNEKKAVAKQLLGIMLDLLLLPYGALISPSAENDSNTAVVTLPVPPGMSEVSFKRVTQNNPMKPEELEENKLGIIKFLGHGIFNSEDILQHLIVGAADTRFSVANLADMELKKIVGSLDWGSVNVTLPLYVLFLGTQGKNVKLEQKKSPACTRIRLKILTYLIRTTGEGFAFPASIQIVFDSLYGTNTNTRLKTLALNFTNSIIRFGNEVALSKVAPLLLTGLQKLLTEGEEAHKGQAYVLIGHLAQRFPNIVYHNVAILETYFKDLETAAQDLKLQIREGALNLILAYKHDIFPEEANKDGRLDILLALVKFRITSQEPMLRFVVVRTLATIFPPDHVPSKFLLLQAAGDTKDDVSAEAFKSLYGTARKSDINLAQNGEDSKRVALPSFQEVTKYVYIEAETNKKDSSKKFTVGNHVLSFPVKTFVETLVYLRLCLVQHLEVPLTREIPKHPCEHTPIIRRHLQTLYKATDDPSDNSLLQYALLVKQLLLTNTAIEPFSCTVELVGCVPDLHGIFSQDLPWVREQLNSTKEETREQASTLYGILLGNAASKREFENAINNLLTQAKTGKTLESKHGALLALGSALEYKIINKTIDVKEIRHLVLSSIQVLDSYLDNQNALLASGSCVSLGLLGRCIALPLEAGNPRKDGSPSAKRPANENISKIDLVYHLLDLMKSSKMTVKVRERAAKSLGLLCVGEDFPHTREILQGFLDVAKETKDVEVHFTIGESLVMCCQSVWSSEARNPWTTSPSEYIPELKVELPDNNLEWILLELLKLVRQPHPNARQASSIWLLAILKDCGSRKPIEENVQVLQKAFMDLLCENNDIVQDVASKGLCVIYDTYKSEDLLQMLVKQLTSGTRHATQVSSDTKLFEEGQLGTTPTGGNLTTYKELCSLASDLNKPDLIYQFLHLANHNAMWNSKKGAAFGFSSIAERCSEDLKPFLSEILPKMYRYQYDPNPNIQNSMHNIWRVLAPEPQKVLDQYYDEILRDILDNLNSAQYRTRQSCCLALRDFLKGSPNRSIHDCTEHMDELWSKIFRVMDDHHEATRTVANGTVRILSKLCIRGCDDSQGKAGVKLIDAILPPLLNNGITNPVAEVRLISLQTISELVLTARKQLKPFLAQLIPALLQATGELESTKLSYLSTMLGGQSQVQEAVDSARASFAKSHFTTETVSKCLEYADASILEELVPKVVELMKGSSSLGTRIACAHFITLLVVEMGQEVQPYTGKLLGTLVNGLTDRNAAIRKHYASTIGSLVSTAKDSSLEKLFAKIQHWYFEREDDTIRSACAQTIQSIGNKNQEILKNYSSTVLPLVFFAMHAEKTPETEKTLEVWTEIWSEHSPGTETGIRQNIEKICDILKTALESSSWTMKAQAANSVSTVASKLGTNLDSQHCGILVDVLLSGLSGRTWNGKDKLLKALASLCSNCRDTLQKNHQDKIAQIVDAVLKECKKEEIVYKNSALESLGDIIQSLEVDKFEEVYSIIQGVILNQNNTSKEDEDMSSEDISTNRESNLKLKQTAYETLGKVWPNTKETQEKYREAFVEHCVTYLPTITRSVQVSVLTALYNYVDKLLLLNQESLEITERRSLEKIVADIIKALQYSLVIPKHMKLRKESLNIVYCLAKKLKERKRTEEFNKLHSAFEELLVEVLKDTQPEIKSRVTDIKNLFKD